ncbi:hypothetical protein ACI3KW_06970 [Devosia sp. ZW T5_3]|uniref:hypothetical protein n=1 Tax=Devosia sp. ZW T5_3 TaxID=3378085 RepID=UPI0038537645
MSEQKMTNTISFRQQERRRVIAIGLLYLAALLALVFFVFGIDASAEFVNSGAEGGIGRFAFVIGIIVLLPVALLLRFMSTPMQVSFDDDNLLIEPKGKPSTRIALADIKSLVTNKPSVNGLYLYGAAGQRLYAFTPQNGEASELLKAILQHKPFKLVSESPAFKGRVMQKRYESR